MRLPNGFGSVYKLSGNRRRPFVVKKTIDGKQKPLGYFETHDAALTFLLKYNHEPTGLTATFADIYEQWKPTKWPALSESSRAAYENSFRHLSRLHDKTMSRLKYLDLQAAMDDVRKIAGYSTQKKCRVLISQLYQFAIKREMATTDYSRYVEIDRHHVVYKKRPFTVREDQPVVEAVRRRNGPGRAYPAIYGTTHRGVPGPATAGYKDPRALHRHPA